MASTEQGRWLTERHRRNQVALRSRFLAALVPLWPLLDWRRIDETAPGWVQAVMAVLRPARQESAQLAVNYYRDYRAVEVPATPVPVPEVEFVQPAPQPLTSGRLLEELDRRRLDAQEVRRTLPDTAPRRLVQRERRPARATIDWSAWDKAAETSLNVTGPGELKRQAKRGVIEVTARKNALVTSSGAASRHVLTGGRETTLTLVQNDQRALGWARVGDDDPCAWCAMLIGRGPVYKSRESASFPAHDLCACTARVIYSRDAAYSEQAREMQRAWRRATAGHSGKDAVNAWRRYYEAQRREQGVSQPLSA